MTYAFVAATRQLFFFFLCVQGIAATVTTQRETLVISISVQSTFGPINYAEGLFGTLSEKKKKVSKAITGFVPIKNSTDINFIGKYLLEKVPRSDSICTFFFFSKNAA